MRYTYVKEYLKVKKELEESIGREPNRDELKNELGFSDELFCEIENLYIDNEERDAVELKFKISVHNEKLVKLRMSIGLSQKELAEKVNLPPQSVGSIENCRVFPDDEVQKKYCDLFKKSESELFPEWLCIFTKSWKEQEKESTVFLNSQRLNNSQTKLICSPDDMIHKADNVVLQSKMKIYLEKLEPRLKKILEMRFGLVDGVSHSLEEVSKEFDITRERIKQLEQKAFEKLKAMEIEVLN